MRIKKGFVLRPVAGQYVVIATGEASKDFYGMVKLNETGADIWKALTEECAEEEIAGRLVDKYEIEENAALTSVQNFIKKMEQAGFMTE